MLNFFDELFGENRDSSGCPLCNKQDFFEVESEVLYLDFEQPDPAEVLKPFFASILEVKNYKEVQALMTSLFYQGVKYGAKDLLIDELDQKVKMIQAIDFDYDDGS